MPRFCAKCGASQSEAARFCPKCGLELAAPEVQPAQAASQPGGFDSPEAGTGPADWETDRGNAPPVVGSATTGAEDTTARMVGPSPGRLCGSCPYCLFKVVDTEPEGTRTCSSCGTRYHRECYEENGGCAVFGCPEWAAGQMAGDDTRFGVAQPASPVSALPLDASIFQLAPAPPGFAVPRPLPGAAPASAAATGGAVRFCRHCGSPAAGGHMFCGYCGGSIP